MNYKLQLDKLKPFAEVIYQSNYFDFDTKVELVFHEQSKRVYHKLHNGAYTSSFFPTCMSEREVLWHLENNRNIYINYRIERINI